MKLISMTDFVLEQGKTSENQISNEAWIDVILGYANFLKQPLTLRMFVPCDEDGNVLEEPSLQDVMNDRGYFNYDKLDKLKEKYQQAKERVLFEGFEGYRVDEHGVFINKIGLTFAYVKDLIDNTIEDLIPYDLTLTQQALKQIGI